MTREVQGNAGVYHERERVQITKNGQLVFDLRWEEAKVLAKLIFSAALKAEEYADANNMVEVQAKFIRAGMAFPVVNDPAIYREAQKEVQWGKERKR